MTDFSVAQPLEARQCLHLGSGLKYRPDSVNVDITPITHPDVVHNLEQFPWPFPDNRFDRLIAHDVLEHLTNLIRTMEEIHRVCRAGSVIDLIVPHFSANGAFADPTHVRFFSWLTFDYFREGHPLSFYTNAKYEIRSRQLIFHPTLANKAIWRLANRFPIAYEQRWAWIFPAYFIHVELTVVK